MPARSGVASGSFPQSLRRGGSYSSKGLFAPCVLKSFVSEMFLEPAGPKVASYWIEILRFLWRASQNCRPATGTLPQKFFLDRVVCYAHYA